MAIEVLDIHHHAVRVDGTIEKLDETHSFYRDVLGMRADERRPTISGVPGYWMNVGTGGQIHLIAGAQPSTLAKSPEQDPTRFHVALGVADIDQTKAELERLGVTYWSMMNVAAPDAEQVFIYDPVGNMIELHQADQCTCMSPAKR